ncbi:MULTISPECIES: hypothetical protein [Paenibacillus]|uniref:hypothetical protein n=1 Tax=Paenibacillus TaxID=44249 RepID=UPI00119CEC3F|nr:hypothetical protein [Paenibacillus sp. IHBB 10380]
MSRKPTHTVHPFNGCIRDPAAVVPGYMSISGIPLCTRHMATLHAASSYPCIIVLGNEDAENLRFSEHDKQSRPEKRSGFSNSPLARQKQAQKGLYP